MVENEEQDENEELEDGQALKPLSGEEALKRARKGKDDWNAWANKEENAGRVVSFWKVNFTIDKNKDISFQDFTFPGEVNFTIAKFGTIRFDGAVFKENAKFSATTFEDRAFFSNAVFEGRAIFLDAYFEKLAVFEGTIFKKVATFRGTTFTGTAALNGSQFEDVPDFRGTDLKKHVSLHGMEVDFRRPTGPNDADMYRRLKELAVIARDHDREQMFFAYELIAKRGFETRGLRLIPNHLYEITSNFGRSLTLPSFWLISVWFMFGIFYRWLETSDKTNHIWDGLSYSAAQLFPFLGASPKALSDAKVALYGNGPLSVGINAMGIVEGILGILFLFLIGLALRNRFRI